MVIFALNLLKHPSKINIFVGLWYGVLQKKKFLQIIICLKYQVISRRHVFGEQRILINGFKVDKKNRFDEVLSFSKNGTFFWSEGRAEQIYFSNFSNKPLL